MPTSQQVGPAVVAILQKYFEGQSLGKLIVDGCFDENITCSIFIQYTKKCLKLVKN